MNKEIVLRLPRVTPTFYEIEATSLLLCDFVRLVGGTSWAGWVGNGVTVRIHGVSRKMLRIGLQAMLNATLENRASLVLVEKLAKKAPLPDPLTEIPWGTVTKPRRLTRHLLFMLPRGAYLVSRRGQNGRSVFAVKLGRNRQAAWRRALEVKAVGRVCYVGWSAAQFSEQRIHWVRVLGRFL
jgi:hypothetical protein